jgi:hypothetical protein
VVWLASLPGDRRSTWDADVMPDPRVAHFWDASRFAGPWFAKNIDGADGFMWDTYLLYGSDATWKDTPSPLFGSGRTIIDTATVLREELAKIKTE